MRIQDRVWDWFCSWRARVCDRRAEEKKGWAHYYWVREAEEWRARRVSGD